MSKFERTAVFRTAAASYKGNSGGSRKRSSGVSKGAYPY
jgi:hypothetical protein